MGCRTSKEEEKPPKQEVFSWDRKDRPDPKDFTIGGQDGGTWGREPGTINGQQFIIENCKNSSIYLYDHSAMVTLDNCENCIVFLGPIKGSVFLRNCKNLKCAIACQQFRSRDCQKIETFLHCQTQPIIESSSGMKFGCFQYFYSDLEEQFKSAGLSVYNNNWCSIHDFTPVDGSDNWQLIPETHAIETSIPKPTEKFTDVDVDFSSTKSVVPLTRSKRPQRYDQSCLVVFFANHKDKCMEFLRRLNETDNCDVIQTKEIKMSKDDANRIFKSDKYDTLCEEGPVVGFEINGTDVIIQCEEGLKQVSLKYNQVFLSSNPKSAKADINAFYNFIDMMMAV